MSKEIKKLETEIVRLRAWVQELEEIGREQDRTISSDKTLIKSLKTTLEALRADAKASQDLHGKNLHEMAHYQICLERRDAELAEAKDELRDAIRLYNRDIDHEIEKVVHLDTTNRPEDGTGIPDDPPGLVRPPDVAFRTAMESNHIALGAEVEQLKGEISKMMLLNGFITKDS